MNKLKAVLRFAVPSIIPCILAAMCTAEASLIRLYQRAEIELWMYAAWKFAFVILVAIGVLFVAMMLLSPQRADSLSIAAGLAVIALLFITMHWGYFLILFDTSGLLLVLLGVVYLAGLVVSLRGHQVA